MILGPQLMDSVHNFEFGLCKKCNDYMRWMWSDIRINYELWL